MANLKTCMLDNPEQIKVVRYNGKKIRYVDYEGKRWISIADFAVAAGYKTTTQAMYDVVKENSLQAFRPWKGKDGGASGAWILVNKAGIETLMHYKTISNFDIRRRETGRWILRELYGEDDRWVADSALDRHPMQQLSLFNVSDRVLQELEDRITKRVYHRVMRDIQGID